MGRELIFILGGARSGKSAHAQSIVEKDGQPALFVATATAGDAEMAARIAAHRASRPKNWRTLETPLKVGQAIRQAELAPWVLVDCITLLAGNVLYSLPQPVEEHACQPAMEEEIAGLLAAYQAHPGRWVIVSNEVGLGLVPPAPESRYYRDMLGWANQRLARAADRVLFMAAGIPLHLKG